MKIAIAGSSGLIGRALCRRWEEAGHQVMRLVRDKPRDRARELYWDYQLDLCDWTPIDGFDALIHLGGKNVACRWSRQARQEIRDSRVESTRFLSRMLGAMASPPAAFLCASAAGYYGDRGDEVLTEESGLGEGFLTEVCREWEAAAGAAAKAGIRTVNLRLGVVLAGAGGALPKMLPPFRLGLGGQLGNGRQFMPWIALDDVLGAIDFLLATPTLSGPVNLTSPEPVTNAAFTRALGRQLHRPTVCRVPAVVLKLLLGDMAREMLLASTRAIPDKLTRAGFAFTQPELAGALLAALGA